MNSWAAMSGLDRPSPASRAIWASRAVSRAGASAVRLRTRSPVANSSRAARPANPAAPIAANISYAVRSCSGVDAPVLAAQPLTIEQMGAPEFPAQASAAKPVDRLPVESLGALALAAQGPRAGLDAERPVAAAGPGGSREPIES